MITIRTRISHSFMFTFNKSPKITVVAIYSQSEYGYLTPSCLSLICDFGYPFWDVVYWHWEHGYNSFMFISDMKNQCTCLYCKIFTFRTRIFDSFMFTFYMKPERTSRGCRKLTRRALMSYSAVNTIDMNLQVISSTYNILTLITKMSSFTCLHSLWFRLLRIKSMIHIFSWIVKD